MSNASQNGAESEMVLAFDNVSKRFKDAVALSHVSLHIARGTIVGLVGRNGCGKTTLLHHATGLMLPTEGACRTFGVPTSQLGASELSRIGAAHQHARLLGWMKVRDLAHHVGTFYERWDAPYATRLGEHLQLDQGVRVETLSPGNVQKLSLVLALSHHPELLLLDEPLSDLDPMARADVVTLLLEYFASHACTMVISSHLLHDIEPMITRVVCLEKGSIAADAELDQLKEEYEEWWVSSRSGRLPSTWPETLVIRAKGSNTEARVIVRGSAETRRAQQLELAVRYDAEIQSRSLNLEALFPVLAGVQAGTVAADRGTPDNAHR